MILVPVSLGELIDKITILKIKQQKITDPVKLQNVNREYDLLYNILKDQQITDEDEHFKQLYEINVEFWDYHDWQRERWQSLDNNENLVDVELYRKNREEHILNDKRAEIKKMINLKYKSEIVEEKQFIHYSI
jgi:hypothetical protein